MKVLITGGSRGIGKSIVDIFSANSHYVIAPTRKELDLSKNTTLVENNFDVIINNAGVNPLASILDIEDYDTTMAINYRAPLQIIQQCLPHMIKQKYGRIINIGSIWINLSKSKRLNYSASKSALHSITKAITCEYSQYNILCNTISPGFIETDLTYQNNSLKELSTIINNIPIKRLGTIEEISKLVYFLTVHNSYISGQNIIIDGGYSCVA